MRKSSHIPEKSPRSNWQSYFFADPNDVIYQYGVGIENFTPNVAADYGPYSIFTGGPELWREGYGNLDGILYQGSRFGNPPVGSNYNVLDIVLYADPGWDVELYGFDLGAFGGDQIINAVTVYDGVPFPFLTPTNDIFEQTNVLVDGTNRTSFDFSANPLQSHVIWLRINADNLGDGSENIGIDNIRFGQIANPNSTDFIDPGVIDAILGEVATPEPSAFALAALGLLSLPLARQRKRRA
jgi:hypothetical protein